MARIGSVGHARSSVGLLDRYDPEDFFDEVVDERGRGRAH
jgi:hypothetical protein